MNLYKKANGIYQKIENERAGIAKKQVKKRFTLFGVAYL
jgi:hypothetical protein